MIVFRLTRSDRVALDGKGAAEYPGRWNSRDIPCVYTSESSSLAQLEMLVNVEDWRIFLSVPHSILRIEVPDRKIQIVMDSDLPANWFDAVSSSKTQDFGTNLLSDPQLVGFSVPSAVNPLERNVILNPMAKEFASVRIVGQTRYKFDKRLLG